MVKLTYVGTLISTLTKPNARRNRQNRITRIVRRRSIFLLLFKFTGKLNAHTTIYIVINELGDKFFYGLLCLFLI